MSRWCGFLVVGALCLLGRAPTKADEGVSPPRHLTAEQRRAWSKVSEQHVYMRKAENGGFLAYFYCLAPCDDAGLAQLALIPDVTEVEVNWSRVITAKGMVHFAAMPSLRKLRLEDVSNLDEAGLAELKRCRSLEELYVFIRELTDEGVKHLADVPKLRKLTIRKAKLTASSIGHFKKMKSLKYLDINSRGLSSEAIKGLHSLRGVTVTVRPEK